MELILSPSNIPVLLTYRREEFQVFFDCESVEQDVMLRTQSQTASNIIHVFPDVVAVDQGRAAGRNSEA